MAKAKPAPPDDKQRSTPAGTYIANRSALSLGGRLYAAGEPIAAEAPPDELDSALRVGFILPAQAVDPDPTKV